ncbi:MAG: single-stranded DNA-binding protein [Gammaproteobacteria bacterium]|nr:single-stranded DNA-binding protein [Gammaproteobacteria bacterium]
MNSFTLTAVGQLARNPELVAKGSTAYTKFCLVGNDYAGKDEEGSAREVVTSLWFVAFGALGEAIARHSRKGDQLFVEARVRGSNWTDKQGEKQYDHSFVVQGFRFGAPGRTKREERANGRDRSANNGAYLSLGRSANVVPHADDTSGSHLRAAADSPATTVDRTVGGADDPVVGNEDAGVNNEAGPTAGADLDTAATAATAGPIAKGIDDVGASEVAGAGGGANHVASGTTKDGARRAASAGANRGSEKTGGGRSSRRATASAA